MIFWSESKQTTCLYYYYRCINQQTKKMKWENGGKINKLHTFLSFSNASNKTLYCILFKAIFSRKKFRWAHEIENVCNNYIQKLIVFHDWMISTWCGRKIPKECFKDCYYIDRCGQFFFFILLLFESPFEMPSLIRTTLMSNVDAMVIVSFVIVVAVFFAFFSVYLSISLKFSSIASAAVLVCDSVPDRIYFDCIIEWNSARCWSLVWKFIGLTFFKWACKWNSESMHQSGPHLNSDLNNFCFFSRCYFCCFIFESSSDMSMHVIVNGIRNSV